MAKEITADVIRQITKNLVEFGYGGLTVDHVQTAVDKLKAGESPPMRLGCLHKGC